MTRTRALLAVAATALLALVVAGTVQATHLPSGSDLADFSAAPSGQHDPGEASTAAAGQGSSLQATAKPLQGKVIVIDPGHQLGNSRHLSEINRLVNAGGFRKACNTTGTSTNSGFPESTFAWRVSLALKRQLEARGATVRMTRHTNSYADWGPCIDVRGRKGNKVGADAVISIHGDGASSGVRGFFVIRPGFRKSWTGDILKPSQRLAVHVKHGLVSAGARASNSYGGDGYDVRTDLGTLNWSNVPAVMVELGNMRNGTDARHMQSHRYRAHVYAHGLRQGLVGFLRH